jgi:anti-sigma factor RsiW
MIAISRIAMILGATNCLVVEQLEAYSSGRLTEDDAEAIAEHLSRCSRCVAALEQLSPSDTLIDAFRAQTLQSLPLSDADHIRQIIQAANELCDSSKDA